MPSPRDIQLGVRARRGLLRLRHGRAGGQVFRNCGDGGRLIWYDSVSDCQPLRSIKMEHCGVRALEPMRLANRCVMFPCIFRGVLGFENPAPHFPANICGAIQCAQGHLHYCGGLVAGGFAKIRPRSLEISSIPSLFACVFWGRRSNCVVFSTPPVLPNALRLSKLDSNLQHSGEEGCEGGCGDQRGHLGGAKQAPAPNPNCVVS